ncbi:non-homologous end-joining DNA ligase [Caballeronia sp. GAWG1-1]|uniref:non-homologous end-joining DNA ligase n=1 Tax=Caballeronia sp. GAWG1-1 TaxID=2921742 RepID=UPI0032ED31AA
MVSYRNASAQPPLDRYKKKRNFSVTSEPSESAQSSKKTRTAKRLSFVVQKHWASRLHYDFRLEHGGVLWSWAVPKGPCYDPSKKQMAVRVEDHPISYAGFEGIIPAKQYGAGTVIVWDRGTWVPVGDANKGMEDGKILFQLHGEKLAGLWELVRISKPGDKADSWMLFKKRDEWARPLAEYDVIKALPDSVIANPLGPIEEREPRIAQSRRAEESNIDLSAAVAAPLPAKFEPQLATLAPSLPTSGDWIIESKLDGYRLLARVSKGRVKLLTRNGHDWTSRFPLLATELKNLPLTNAWLDGEIVVLKDGIPSFSALQTAIDGQGNRDIIFFLFDLMYLDGKDLRQVPLWSRRALLAPIVQGAGEHLIYSQDFDAPAAQIFEAATGLGLEGLMLKQRDARYESGRTQTWLKAKARLRQELIICGMTARAGTSSEVGSLLLGYYAGNELNDAGSVGTGWDSKTARDLWKRLAPFEVDKPPFDTPLKKPGRWSKRTLGSERWLRPTSVAEVEFAEWTAEKKRNSPSVFHWPASRQGRSRRRTRSGNDTGAGAPTAVKDNSSRTSD